MTYRWNFQLQLFFKRKSPQSCRASGQCWNKLFRLAKRAGRLPRLPGGAEFEMEYKNTLNLPQTDFPMRAGLVQREPERLAKWYADSLYEQIQKRREGAERFLLHDGPPFANGDVHIGTALNKILKDLSLIHI